MKSLFKLYRKIQGPFLLLHERLTQPKSIVRSEKEQAQIDAETKSMILYQFKTCPYCSHVRKEIKRLALSIKEYNIEQDTESRDALLTMTTRARVPCLQVTRPDGRPHLLTESGEIIKYLRRRFEPD